MSTSIRILPRTFSGGVDPTSRSRGSFTSAVKRRVASTPSACCRRLWNLILTGYLRCPKCGFPDGPTAEQFWKDWPGV